MAKRRRTSDDFDTPWKDALHAYLRAFLAFFFPDIHADIDWSRGYVALDKEFQPILRRAAVGKRLADKLFKVWLKDGTERWLLIHIEIQGEPEKEFERRMFEYNIAIRQVYNHDVISLAMLCDDDPTWRPTTFAYGEWGCKMELTFRIAKLLDYAGDLESLERDNLLAAVVLAHQQTLKTRTDPVTRGQLKLQLVKKLYRGSLSRDDVRQLFRLVDWFMTLPADLEEIFRTEIYQFEEELHVQYLSSIERFGFEKGRAEGRAEGREEGREEGLLDAIALILEDKFGAAGRRLLRKIRALKDREKLRRLAGFLATAKTLDQVRDYLE